MDMVQLLFATGVHFVVGWIYLFLSLLFLPPVANLEKREKKSILTATGQSVIAAGGPQH